MMIIKLLFMNMVPQHKNSNYIVCTNAQKLHKKQNRQEHKKITNQALSEQPHFIPRITFLSHVNTFWVNDQLDAQLRHIKVYYFNPLHVSSNSVLIIRRSNCFNTASGIVFCK